MNSAHQQPTPRPTLEDLLRFKRAERPPQEFWAEFDCGLRQKQLAALMKRPQGWERWRPVFVVGLRWGVPATAAAAVALVILQVPGGSVSRQDSLATVEAPRPQTVASAELPAPLPVVESATAVAQVQSGTSTPQEQAPVVALAEQPPAPAQLAVATASEHSLPWSAAALASTNTSDFSPVAFRPVRQAARETRRPSSSWTSRFNEMVRDLSAERSEARVLQLASMSLSAATPYPVASAPVMAAQSVASNGRNGRALNEREFRDLDSRFGVKGSSVSIKF